MLPCSLVVHMNKAGTLKCFLSMHMVFINEKQLIVVCSTEPLHHSLPVSQDPPVSIEQSRHQVPIQHDSTQKALALPTASLQHHESSPSQNDSLDTGPTVVPQNGPVVPTPDPDPTPNEEVFFC